VCGDRWGEGLHSHSNIAFAFQHFLSDDVTHVNKGMVDRARGPFFLLHYLKMRFFVVDM